MPYFKMHGAFDIIFTTCSTIYFQWRVEG
uniref:Uncharacterized protein n=1 Tax=Anguilla anguilla TaxID=7936 RepID=A0A0E9QNQ6_ANGAN